MNIDFAGIWIDTKEAIFISLNKNEKHIRTIPSNIGTRERIPGQSNDNSSNGSSDSSRDAKRKQQTKAFFKSLADELKSGDFDFVVFGPAGMKFEFDKELNQTWPELSGRLESVVTTDHMTENQMVAWVREYYDDIKVVEEV